VKIKKVSLGCMAPIVFAGCIVQSLNPFYMKDMKVAMPQIEGSWTLMKELGSEVKTPQEINPWTVKGIKQEGGVSSYEVNAFDTKNQQGRLTVVFFKVNEVTYCDILPARDSNANRYWSANMCPLHTLCKVEMAVDTVRLLPLNKGWMENNIKEKRIALSFLKHQQFVGHLINASTEEWKAFLEQYGKTAGVFTDERVFELKRVQEGPPADGKPAAEEKAPAKDTPPAQR
jgi:hypothetical protein